VAGLPWLLLTVTPHHPFSGDVVDALAQRCIVGALSCPGFMGLPPLQISEFVDKPHALPISAVKRRLQLPFLGDEVLDGGIGAAIDLDDGDAQIVFGFARDFDFAAQMREFGFAFVQQQRSLGKPVFQIFPGALLLAFVFSSLHR